MTPQDFKKAWTKDGEQLFPLSINRLTNLDLQKETIAFLNISGLPESAAPFLSFVNDTDDLYKGINKLTVQYKILAHQYERYIVIGSDGSGNPIVINTSKQDCIEILDHEDNFSSIYMNKSIKELVETLVAYRDFINTLLKENGEDAVLDSNFTDSQYEDLKQKILLIDIKALTEDGFWKDELELLLTNREYYKQN